MPLRLLTRLAALVSLLLAFCFSSVGQTAIPKRRIAIMDFDYGAVQSTTPLAEFFGGDQDLGKGITALLISKLVKDGKYTLIEYAAIDKVLAEQDFSKTERADPLIASRVGRILGVDAILIGTITRFGPEHAPPKTSGKGNPFSPMSGHGSAGINKSKAAVELTVRVVNPMTGDVIASAVGTGLSAEEGSFYYASFQTKQGMFDFSSSQFANTVLGQAAYAAVDQTATQLNAIAGKIPFAKYAVTGLVADVSGGELTLNVGTRDGVKPGDKLQVRHLVRTIQIPLPGAGVREITEDVGFATVTALEAGSATATFSGKGPVAVGDAVSSLP
jgi:curli biogenesis system outer membrane secretion channel CsgG